MAPYRKARTISLASAATGMSHDFGKVHGLAMRQLRDLFPATEAVGHNQRHGAGGLDGWKQAILGDGLGDLKFAFLEAEGAGHSTAAGLDGLNRGTGLPQQRYFAGRTAKNRLMVAVTVEQNMCACESSSCPFRCFGGKPIGEEPGLFA